jgi:hypothetical protein
MKPLDQIGTIVGAAIAAVVACIMGIRRWGGRTSSGYPANGGRTDHRLTVLEAADLTCQSERASMVARLGRHSREIAVLENTINNQSSRLTEIDSGLRESIDSLAAQITTSVDKLASRLEGTLQRHVDEEVELRTRVALLEQITQQPPRKPGSQLH